MRLAPADTPPADEPAAGVRGPAGAITENERVAHALGVSEHQLDSWVEAGLVRLVPRDPGHPCYVEIDLADAALVRSLCDSPHPGRQPPARQPPALRRVLDRLRSRLPTASEPTRDLTLVEQNGTLLVRLDDDTLADDAGQFCLDFRPSPHPAPVLGRLGPPQPTSAAQWHQRGVEQEMDGDLDAAVRSYLQALSVGGPDAQVVFDLAYALAEAGEHQRAIERYRQVVEIDPKRQDAWVNLGDLLLADGRTAGAVDAFRRALDLDPDDTDAHYNLADALDSIGLPAAARPHWERFLRETDADDERTAYARHRLGSS